MGYNSSQVLKALTVLVKNVPKQMAVWLPQILPPVWATLTTSAEKYVREVVNEGGEEEDVVDSDGEVPDVRMLELFTFFRCSVLKTWCLPSSSLSTPWWRLPSSRGQ